MVPEKGFMGLRTNNRLRKACIIAINTQLFNAVVLATIGINCIFLSTETNSPKFPQTPWGKAGHSAEYAPTQLAPSQLTPSAHVSICSGGLINKYTEYRRRQVVFQRNLLHGNGHESGGARFLPRGGHLPERQLEPVCHHRQPAVPAALPTPAPAPGAESLRHIRMDFVVVVLSLLQYAKGMGNFTALRRASAQRPAPSAAALRLWTRALHHICTGWILQVQ